MPVKVGDRACAKRVFVEEDVRMFGELSRDMNPVHFDDEAACALGFEGRIIHGFLVGSMISALIAEKVPGPGSVYLSQTMEFKAPVRIGDEVEAVVEIADIKKDRIFFLTTKCIGADGTAFITGEAVVLNKVAAGRKDNDE